MELNAVLTEATFATPAWIFAVDGVWLFVPTVPQFEADPPCLAFTNARQAIPNGWAESAIGTVPFAPTFKIPISSTPNPTAICPFALNRSGMDAAILSRQ